MPHYLKNDLDLYILKFNTTDTGVMPSLILCSQEWYHIKEGACTKYISQGSPHIFQPLLTFSQISDVQNNDKNNWWI